MKRPAPHSPSRKYPAAQEIPSLLVVAGRRLLQEPGRAWSILLGVGWGVLLVLILFLALDSLAGVPGNDSGIFMYVAQGIMEGDVPYLDRWDHKGPLIYLINVGGLVIDDVWGIWVVEGIFLLATTWLAFAIVKARFGLVAASFAVAIFLIYYGRFFEGGNLTEQYALLFQFLALYLFILAESRGSRTKITLAIGILSALAFLLRPDLVGVWLAIGIYWWIFHRDKALKLTLWSALGAMVVFLSVTAIFASVGGFYEFWDAFFVFNFIYSDTTFAARADVVLDLGSSLNFVLLPLLGAWCIGLHHTLRKAGSYSLDGIVKLAVILLPIEIILISLPGRQFDHYYLAILPVLTILIGFFVHVVVKNLPIPVSLVSTGLLLITSLYYVPDVWGDLYLERYIEKYRSENGITTYHEWYRDVTEYIHKRTDPDDLILVTTFNPLLYTLSDRGAPSRFFYISLPGKNGLRNSDVDEFISDVKQKSPSFIIDKRSSNISYAPDTTPYESVSVLAPLADFVKEKYQFVQKFGSHGIYAHVDKLKELTNEYRQINVDDLIIRSRFDVYFDGTSLRYVKAPCTPSDVEERFFLHLTPEDPNQLPEHRRQYGFDNLDFNFSYYGIIFEDRCLATVDLPDYAISSISTGQFTSGKGRSWSGDVHFGE